MGAVPQVVIADRVVGAVLASAAGDALGAGYEFGPALPDTEAILMKGGGAFRWAPGEWTDDTQMALAILRPPATGDKRVAAIEQGFREWFSARPADVGSQTRAVLGRPGPLGEAAAAYQAGNPNGAGNGSLMRTGPVALGSLGDRTAIAERAAEISALTHPHADCVDACVLWSLAIDHAIATAPGRGTYDWIASMREGLSALPPDRRDRWSTLIDEAASESPRTFTNNGWVVHAFQAALASIVHTPVPDELPCRHLELALAAAVRCGNDTDTVAAIAGSLLGARWGATAVPSAWRRLIHGRITNAKPAIAASALDTMARLVLRGGQPDRIGWPGVGTLLPHYRATVGQRVVRVALADVANVVFGNVAALPQALRDGATVVISMCRTGTDDVPASCDHEVVGLIDTTLEENPNLEFVLTDTADAIHAARDRGRTVFVHCVAAEHRTPTIAAAYLIRHGGRSVNEAVGIVEREFRSRPRPMLLQGLAGVRPVR